MGDIVKYRLPCTAADSCGSSDAMVKYDDGGKYCHKCGGHDNREKTGDYSGTSGERPKEKRMTGKTNFDYYFNSEIKSIPDRRLGEDECKKYGVRTSDNGDIHFPYYNAAEELVAVKTRKGKDKNFSIKGDMSAAMPFGYQAFPKTGMMLTITEGEYDAMAAYKMGGSKYANVSIKNGINGAKNDFKVAYEYIDAFDNITLNFDSDKVGKDGAEVVAPMFPGKVKILSLTEGKDANDYLLSNKITKYVEEFWKARKFTLGGIINGADTWEAYKAKKDIKSIPWPSTWSSLEQKTYGIRRGEIVLVTAGTGSGKTQLLRELKYHYLMSTEEKIGDISLEEDLGDSVGGLMALHANKRLTLPDVHVEEAEEKRIHDELFGTGRCFFLDHEGSVEDESLLDKINYLAEVDGCTLVFLDHITIAVSDCAAGSENMSMDKFMNRLLKIVKRKNICVVVISHLRKVGSGGKSFEEGRIPTEDDLKGSGSLKQIAMTTIALSRNKYAQDEAERNTTQTHVLKCRFTGRTGPSDYLRFIDETGRMIVVDPAKDVGGTEDGFESY